jgi:transcriptional regulator with XRE-family HTH domain
MGEQPSPNLLEEIVEPRRKRLGLSLRKAADRAGMSEATWRQLVRGGVNVRDEWVRRAPRRSQLLTMAAAVSEEALALMSDALEASTEELDQARRQVHVPDPAEEEILTSRHLRPEEKLRLVETLRLVRGQAADDSEAPRAG